MHSNTHTGLAMAALVGICLSGCGGGGSDAAPTLVTPTNVSVETDPNTTSKVVSNIPMDSPPPVLQLRAVVRGDVASLNGTTVYTTVDDPEGLIQGLPRLVVSPNSPVVEIELQLRPQLVEGYRRGTFRVHACMDAACNTKLRGSPLSYDYELKWVKPLKANVQLIQASRVYGSSDDVKVEFSATAGKDATVAASLESYSDPDYQVVATDPRLSLDFTALAGAGSWAGTMKFQPAAPGVHTSYVYLTSSEPGAGTFAYGQSHLVNVRYEVIDDPAVALAFSPGRAIFTLSAADAAARKLPPGVEVRPLARPGDAVRLKGISYVSVPAAAVGVQGSEAWLRLDNLQVSGKAIGRWVASIDGFCRLLAPVTPGSIPETVCLPSGTYTANALFEVQRSGGAVSEVAFPIAFEIQK